MEEPVKLSKPRRKRKGLKYKRQIFTSLPTISELEEQHSSANVLQVMAPLDQGSFFGQATVSLSLAAASRTVQNTLLYGGMKPVRSRRNSKKRCDEIQDSLESAGEAMIEALEDGETRIFLKPRIVRSAKIRLLNTDICGYSLQQNLREGCEQKGKGSRNPLDSAQDLEFRHIGLRFMQPKPQTVGVLEDRGYPQSLSTNDQPELPFALIGRKQEESTSTNNFSSKLVQLFGKNSHENSRISSMRPENASRHEESGYEQEGSWQRQLKPVDIGSHEHFQEEQSNRNSDQAESGSHNGPWEGSACGSDDSEHGSQPDRRESSIKDGYEEVDWPDAKHFQIGQSGRDMAVSADIDLGSLPTHLMMSSGDTGPGSGSELEPQSTHEKPAAHYFAEAEAYGEVGKLAFFNGDMYEGQCQMGIPHGYGCEAKPDQHYYSGSFLHGQRSGTGVCQHFDGKTYSGTFSKGLAQGYGSLETSTGQCLQGSFCGGRVHGWGVRFYPDGTEAAGRWHLDQLQWSRIISSDHDIRGLSSLDIAGVEQAMNAARFARQKAWEAITSSRTARQCCNMSAQKQLSPWRKVSP